MFRNKENILYILNKSIYSVWMLYDKTLNHVCIRSFSNKALERELSKSIKKQEWKSDKKGLAKILAELLDLKPSVARSVFENKFKISSVTILENFDCCLNNGILKETLQKFPEVLAGPDIPSKIIQLEELQHDINITTPLLYLPYNRLKTFISGEIETNRITLLSQLLGIEKSEVCIFLSRKIFLLSLKVNQLSDNMKLLTDNGISREEIIKDLWVLRYSTVVINERLDSAKKNNIDTFKTWMVRAQPEIFERYIRRRSDTKLILGDSSLTQYLSERLECTEELAKYIISKQPALQNKSLIKMNEMIDYLFKCGFKPIHICRVPKILLHGVETTRQRIKQLESTGMHLDSLYLLTKSQRQYMQYYESLVKTSKNKSKGT